MKRLFFNGRFFSTASLSMALAVLTACVSLSAFDVGRAHAQFGLNALGGGLDDSAGDLTVQASILPPQGNRPARLSIAVDIPAGWHTYSITQPPGGPNRTAIKLDRSADYKLAVDFVADTPPHVRMDEAFPGLPQEEHTGHVTWTAPLELRGGVDLKRLQITGSVVAQRCASASSCLPPKPFKFTATLAGGTAPTAAIDSPLTPASRNAPPVEEVVGTLGEYRARAPHSDAQVRGWIESPRVAPDSRIRVVLTVTPPAGAHVYGLAAHDPKTPGQGKPTLLSLAVFHAGSDSGWKVDAPQPDHTPEMENSDVGIQSVYSEPVRWTVDVHVPQGAAGCFMLDGVIGYQTCTAESCTQPTAARFAGKVVVLAGASNTTQQPAPLSFFPATYGAAPKPIEDISVAATAPPGAENSQFPPETAASALFGQLHPRIKGSEPASFVTVILFGLLGGLILNLMPCVLPVIGLKILAFVQQSGQSRARALVLNVWYSLGLLSVFMVLATLAVNLHLKWGQQFQTPAFVVALCGIVFVMALSFLGVWEIPIPGFVGSGKSAKLAAKEGAAGAFAKGALTTVLATPCSGPYLAAVFSYALTQSPLVTYLVFASIGLGMASPYLLIGAFPGLVRFLPKPGAWMETFKQIMGFILLGTVVYLFSLLEQTLFLPVLTFVVGLWAGCWWIGRTPLTANFPRKLMAWIGGAAIAGAVGWFAFTVVVPHKALLDWEPYSTAKLEQLLAERKTVMVDFTANWCPNCHFNSAHAINTPRVEQLVRANGVVPLLADWSNPSPEIEHMLEALRSHSIPVLAVFPSDHPNEPIVLRDLVSQADVVDVLHEAGPSRTGLAAAEPIRR